MKKIGFMLVLVVLTMNLFSQKKDQKKEQKADSSKIEMSSIKELPTPKYQLTVTSPIDATTGMLTDQNLVIEGDTVAAVLDLLKNVQEKTEVIQAVQNILQYITYDGKVSDIKKYQEAVTDYKKLMNSLRARNNPKGKAKENKERRENR